MTRDQCIAFQKNSTVNPLTLRAIKLNGPTYMKLQKMCKPTKASTPKPHRASVPKQNKKVKKYVALFILGLGCSASEEHKLRKYADVLGKRTNIPLKMLCNESLGNTLNGIVQRVCYMVPNKKNKFIQEIYECVNTYLNDNVEVLLVGHSYGGMCASLVAEIFNDKPNPGLHVATFGSIYISKQKDTNNVDLKHYMYKHDVAMKCNKISEKTHQFVKWMPSSLKSTPRFSLLGTTAQWDVHNNYGDLIEKVLIERKVDVNFANL